jgi:hypothetical protein
MHWWPWDGSRMALHSTRDRVGEALASAFREMVLAKII